MKKAKIFLVALCALTAPIVLAQPIANFTASTTSVCQGDNVSFIDLSTGSPIIWSWSFPGGTPASSGSQNPTITYNTAGTYSVTLIVTDTAFTSDTITLVSYINVSLPATVDAGPDQLICRNTLAYLSGFVSGSTTTGVWSTLGSGTFNNTTALNAIYTPSAADTTAGYVDLVLISTNNGSCTAVSDTVGMWLTTDSAGTVTISSTNALCNGLCDGTATATVSGGTAPFTYLWDDIMVQSAVTAIGLCGGTYNVFVTDTAGCLVKASAVIFEPSLLTSTLTQTDPSSPGSCDGFINATGTSGGVPPYTYIWDDPIITTTALVSNLCAGTFCITITDANGCTYSNCEVIVDPPCGLSITTTVTNIICNGVCDGNASATPSGGILPYTYNWSNGATTATANTLCAGTYSVTVTDSTGCSQIANATITEPTPITPSTTSTNPSAPGNCDGSATVTPTGGTPPYAYLWNDSTFQTTSIATALCAGTYCVAITDANGCQDSTCVTLIDSGCTLAATISITNATCSGGCDGSATATPSGGTAPYTYLWNDTLAQTTATAISLCAASYGVTVVDNGGCTVVAAATVTAPAGMNLSFIITNPSSQGGNDGAIDMTVSGGTIPYTYLWSNSNNIEDISNLVSGTYFVTVTDSSGCTQTGTATLIDPSCGFTFTTSSTPATCGDSSGTATATISGGTTPITYLWDDMLAQTTSTAIGLMAGIYTVSITDSLGCVDSDTVSVNSTGVNVGISKTDPSSPGVCDGTASATSTGGTAPYSYSWNTTPVQTGAVATGLCDGTYCATVTDAMGCIQVACITLVDSCAFSVALTSANVSCNGICDGSATVNPSGGVPPYNYLWSDGSILQTASSLCAGTYGVSVTDTTGCVVTSSLAITQPTALSAAISATNTSGPGNCDGSATVTPTGGTGTYTYQWDNPGLQTTATATGLCSGPITVIVVDANGCTMTISTTVADPACSFTVTTSSTAVTCGLSDGTATAAVSGGTPPYTYLWDDAAAQTTATATGLGVGAFMVAVTDSTGCTAIYSVAVNSASTLAVTTTKTDPSSPGACDGTASATSTGGTAPYSYGWNTVPVQTGVNATGLCAGNYCASVTDANGCMANSCITLVDSCAFTVTLTSTDVSCNGACDGSASAVPSGGIGPYAYLWNTGDTAQTVPLCAGTFTVTIVDSTGCTVSIAVTITEPLMLSATTFSTGTSGPGNCDGDATVIMAGGTIPYTYLWDDSLAQTTATAINLCSGIYNIVVADFSGCVSTASVTVVDSSCAFSITTTSTDATCGICDGTAMASISGGTPPYSYTWNTVPVQTNATASNLCVNSYTVAVTDATGCTATATTTVNSASGLSMSMLTNDPSGPGNCDGSATAQPTGGTPPYDYLWDNSNTTSDAVGLCAGTYCVTITDAASCAVTSCATLVDSSCSISFLAPTITNTSCNGMNDGSVTVTPTGGIAPYIYLWSDSTAQTTQSATGLGAGTYACVVTDTASCTASTTATISEPANVALVVSTISPTSCGICDGTASVAVSGGTVPYSYTWSSGGTTTTEISLCTGFYGVTITDANACTGTAIVSIGSVCDSVWPGDANSDGVANNVDLLSIGIAYGDTGPVRPGATLNWSAQYAPDWVGTFTSGVNYKFADCNGDAVVDANDTLAINLNYGFTHNKAPMPNLALATDPALYLDVNIDTIGTGMQLTVPVMLGTSSIPATGVYGLAFTINYDPSLIDTSSARIKFDNSWLGTTGTDLISLQMDRYLDGQIDVAVSRTDMNNVDGFGQIASIGIVTIDNLSGKVSIIDTMLFSISNVTLISSDETVNPVNYGEDSVIVKDTTTTGIHDPLLKLRLETRVYPNPANDLLNIEWSDEVAIDRVTLYNVIGEKLEETLAPADGKLVINVESYNSGIYFIQIEVQDGMIVKKLSIK